jgi:large subunit ribosomal protein L17
MRHRVRHRKLGRTGSHRSALLSSLATSLLKHKRIRTTLAKAKETRSYVESLITKARKNNLLARRQIMSVIHDKEVVKELFNEIIPKIGPRPGGYTRVVKLGNRIGDSASMAVIELVDYNDVTNAKAETQKEKRQTRKEAKIEAEQNQNVDEAQVLEESSGKK